MSHFTEAKVPLKAAALPFVKEALEQMGFVVLEDTLAEDHYGQEVQGRLVVRKDRERLSNANEDEFAPYWGDIAVTVDESGDLKFHIDDMDCNNNGSRCSGQVTNEVQTQHHGLANHVAAMAQALQVRSKLPTRQRKKAQIKRTQKGVQLVIAT